MRTEPEPAKPGTIDSAREWRSSLTGGVLGLLLFETVSGLGLFFFPFSRFQQFSVLIHTVLGLLMILPVVWYLVRHIRQRWHGSFSHYKLLGYLSALILLVITVSGIVLTVQAWFGTRISAFWDQTHLITTFALVAVLGAHLLTLIVRKSNQPPVRRAWRLGFAQATLWTAGLLGLCWVGVMLYPGDDFVAAFPEEYDFKYGVDRPFAPSLARKDMSAVERTLQNEIAGLLDPAQAGHFIKNFKIDPVKHEGLVSVAARLCGEMKLNPEQQAGIDAALERARVKFRTAGRVDPRRLAGSQSCGTSGCHSQILEEWEPSAHRYAAMDIVFQKVQDIMVYDKDPQTTRYCAGCHDPISLLSGAKNAQNVTLSAHGADEGISCVVCHSIVQTDVRGNADYTIQPPDPYLFEYNEGTLAKKVSDFLIRAYPRHHVESYSRPLYKTTEYCGACHKQYIDEEVNDFGWVQGQNQYDSWRKSRWNVEGHPEKTLSCRECHMPLTDSTDPAAGDFDDRTRSPDDGKHRSHRTLGANQFIPLYHQLRGAEEQVEQITRWLRGEYEVPEIREKWTEGPVVRLNLVLPDEVKPGEEVEIRTTLTNNKTGHNFPTGPLDMIESWVELTVTDEAGRILYRSGTLDEKGYLENPRIVFKKELIDREGRLVDRHNLWDAVGARYGRALFPGFTDTTRFNFQCPGMTGPEAAVGRDGSKPSESFTLTSPGVAPGSVLQVKAILWYSKFKAPFMDRVFGEKAGMRAPATAVSEASGLIRVVRP